MTDIFLSYASADRERVRPLVDALEKMGWSVWWDTAILPGVSWNDEIAKALDAARCVIVVWSSTSVHSEWVREESREGQRRHALIPVMLERVEIPLGFRGLQAANLTGWQGHAEHSEFQKVVRSVTQFAPLGAAMAAGGGSAPRAVPETSKAAVPIAVLAPKGRSFSLLGSIAAVVVLIGVGAYLWLRPKPTPAVVVAKPSVSQSVAPAVIPAGQGRVNTKDQLKYSYIPAGTFKMGCSTFDEQCLPVEKPAHEVTISQGFWIGQTEVTQAAYRAITELNRSAFKGDTLPAESMNWFEAKSYCESMGMDLPTEAQWEYAVRAADNNHGTYGTLADIAWFNGNAAGTTHPVAQKSANAWGLYDMLGNAWEWVEDWYDASKTRVLRGGSWYNDARSARVSYRLAHDPAQGSSHIGFRCAGDLP